MPSPITFSLGQFEVDLAELAGTIRDIASVKLDQIAKEAVQGVVTEARKSFDAVVDVLTPLYALNTPAKVRAEFPSLYANFKNTYLKNSNEIRTHCHIVVEQMDKLMSSQAWKQNIPILQNAFRRLEAAKVRWVGNDASLADGMQRFLNDVNGGLNDVLAKVNSSDREAYAALNDLISDSEETLLRIKSQLNQLTIVSSQLRTN